MLKDETIKKKILFKKTTNKNSRQLEATTKPIIQVMRFR